MREESAISAIPFPPRKSKQSFNSNEYGESGGTVVTPDVRDALQLLTDRLAMSTNTGKHYNCNNYQPEVFDLRLVADQSRALSGGL
jgi:hypothetical protein